MRHGKKKPLAMGITGGWGPQRKQEEKALVGNPDMKSAPTTGKCLCGFRRLLLLVVDDCVRQCNAPA
jgi:hypothetical protein